MRESNPIYDFTEISLYKIGQQVSHGLSYLSDARIIHGDVAARNMLVGEVRTSIVVLLFPILFVVAIDKFPLKQDLS